MIGIMVIVSTFEADDSIVSVVKERRNYYGKRTRLTDDQTRITTVNQETTLSQNGNGKNESIPKIYIYI